LAIRLKEGEIALAEGELPPPNSMRADPLDRVRARRPLSIMPEMRIRATRWPPNPGNGEDASCLASPGKIVTEASGAQVILEWVAEQKLRG